MDKYGDFKQYELISSTSITITRANDYKTLIFFLCIGTQYHTKLHIIFLKDFNISSSNFSVLWKFRSSTYHYYFLGKEFRLSTTYADWTYGHFHSKMLTDSFLLFIFLAGASINFIPYFLGYSLKDPETNEYPDFIVALSDSKYAASIIFSLSTMLPILLDSICDFLIHKFSKDKETLFNISPINIPFREIIFILIIPDILLLLWIFPCSKYDLIAPLIASRDTMYIFCFLAYLVKFGNRIWTQSTIVLIGGPLMITNVFITCEVLLSDYSPYQDAYQVITPTLISLALAAVTITLMRWYYYMIYEKDYSEIVLESARSKNDFMCTIFCTLLGMYLYLDWVIFYIPQPISSTWSYIGPDYLSMDNYLMAGCTLCMTTLINRFARVDAIDSRVK